jgi:hypothetical protein
MKKKEDARLAVLREYDRWAKEHPDDAKKLGGFARYGVNRHDQFRVTISIGCARLNDRS